MDFQCLFIFFNNMVKLIDILFEDWSDKKQKIPDNKFTTYFMSFVIKFRKSLNKNEVIERIRGIKNVTIVEIHKPKKMIDWSKKSKEYEYNLVDIKFNTNLSPSEEISKIKFAMMRADDENDIYFIQGIAAVKPLYDTLLKLDVKGFTKKLKINPVD